LGLNRPPGAPARRSIRPMTLTIGALQLLLVLTWTTYAALLPGLVAAAGMDKAVIPWLLLADQVIFLVADPLLGFISGTMLRVWRRIGLPMAAMALASALCFVALPLTAPLGQWGLLLPLLVWAITSSVLRAPLAVMLQRHAPAHRSVRALVLATAGQALGMVFAPSLTALLAGRDPLLPVLLASLVLAVAVVVLVVVDGTRTPPALPPREPWRARSVLALGFVLAGLAAVNLGVQLHGTLRAPALAATLMGKAAIPWAVPAFAVGQLVAMACWTPLFGLLRPAVGGALGALALALGLSLAALAPAGPLLVGCSLVAGGAWGAVLATSLQQAVSLAPPGRPGLALGLTSSVFAGMAALRLLGVAEGFWAGVDPARIDVAVCVLALLGAPLLLVTSLVARE
jgi:Major Facilitator Superfamily